MATVTINQGTLKGGRSATDSGFEYLEFLGIPYAKPPVGELRFKSPQSPEPWEGIRDATTTDPSKISVQVDLQTGAVTGSEDCLCLNVYTPALPAADTKLKPVMVLSHGGGFISGNGILKNESGPDYLIKNDVVVVTINYRLGPLGFLCLEIPEAAGNMGLKDHVKALQWVQNNIENFGGDKDNVTIFGVSAGSAACEYLMISPLAKGLFHKCILQSGSSLNDWAITFPVKTRALTYKLAQALGFTGEDDHITGMYKVLFSASATDLTSAAFKIAQEEHSMRISFGFVPVIEQDFGNGDAFLILTPYYLLNEGTFNHVPVIRGYCNKKGVLAKVLVPNAITKLRKTKCFVDHLFRPLEEIDSNKYDTELKTVYIDNDKSNDVSEDFAVKFFGDLNFAAGINLAGKLQSKKVPVYMYKFSYNGKLSIFQSLFGLKEDGAVHGDDVGYLLRHIATSSVVPDDADLLIRAWITKMWTNFAKTGNPTPADCSELPVKWPMFTNDSKKYLNINNDFTIESDYEPEKLFIHDQIIHKYRKHPRCYLGGPIEMDYLWEYHMRFACLGLNCCKKHDGC